MYPWIRDAAAAAAAAAVGFAGSHHHHHYNHHHHQGQNPGLSMNGGIKGENGYPPQPNSVNDCMLALDYAHNKKAAAAAAFFWNNTNGSGNSSTPNPSIGQSSPREDQLRHHTQTPQSPLHLQHNQTQQRFNIPESHPHSGENNSNSRGNNNYSSGRHHHPSGGGIDSPPGSISPSQSPPSPASVTAVSIVHPNHNHNSDHSGGHIGGGNNTNTTTSTGTGSPIQQRNGHNNTNNNNSNNNGSSSDPGGQTSSGAAGNAQLMHWMSAVMAEHINHHTAVDGVHYVWNGGAVEGKLNSPENHHNSIKSVDPTSPTLPHLYGAPRSNNSGSSLSSSPPSSAGLVVPQPLSSGQGNHKNPHNPTANGGTGRKYQCKMCPQIFTSKADLQLHTQIHMREAKPYKCSQCTKAFANSSYLSQHTRIHLGIKPYRCEICQRKFTQLSHLQQHIRTHTGDKPYKCRHPGCNKAFSQLSNLQSHSRCHQTDKPYKCNSCYKCFTDEASLLDHIPKHKESKHLKTHICNYCGKSYTQETYLTKHMQKHAEKSEKRMARQNNNNNNNNNHHQTNGTGNTNGNGQAHQVNNHQNSNSNNVLPSPEMYWNKSDIGESSPPSMCLPTGGLLGRPGSEGPDDLRVNNLGQHHQAQSPTPTSLSYDAIANVIASSKSAGASAFTPIQTSAMLQIPANMASGGAPPGRAYLPYEPLSFQKSGHHQMSAMDMKSPGNAFPNQLISLHQIRNYAHQPTMTPEHLLGLKDK